jgi:hypothetical protein
LITGIADEPEFEPRAPMTARISRPAKTAMQSGTAKTHRWLLEFSSEKARTVDPLMGWTGSDETLQQVKLWFDTEADAVAYAVKHGIAYQVELPQDAKRRTISYSDNFRSNRVGSWTH